MWLRRAADHSPASSAAVMEEYSYTSTHPLGHTGPVTGKLYLYLTVNLSQHKRMNSVKIVTPSQVHITSKYKNLKHSVKMQCDYISVKVIYKYIYVCVCVCVYKLLSM